MDTNKQHKKNLQETIYKYGQDEWKNRDAAFHSYLAHIFCDNFQENVLFLSGCTDYEFYVLCSALYEILVIAEYRGEDLKEIMSEVHSRASEVEDDRLSPYIVHYIKWVQAWRPALKPNSY